MVGYRQAYEELRLTRNLLLADDSGRDRLFGGGLPNLHRYRCVTHWEELLCVAINTRLECLMAVVSIRQPDGYSSIVSDGGSNEFIRFFVDWGRGESYQPAGLHSFEVCDPIHVDEPGGLPYHQLITIKFDADRYWDSILDGIQPKVCGVLSWNQAPPEESGFEPIFGNRIESRIRTESIKDVLSLYQHP
jgi:hypothetical protein